MQAVLTTMPFVVAVYMVRDWQGELATEQAVGKATGLLAAVFCAAQLCTSFPWGLISDRIGRKVGGWVGVHGAMVAGLYGGRPLCMPLCHPCTHHTRPPAPSPHRSRCWS